MTPSDLDEIRKRCEAATLRESVCLSAADRGAAEFHKRAHEDVMALLAEVERLQHLLADVDVDVFVRVTAEREQLERQLRTWKANHDQRKAERDALREQVEQLSGINEAHDEQCAENEKLRAEIADLRNRPPMNCTACEDFNLDLADENKRLQAENDELREAISDDAAATLADRNRIRRQMHAVRDALVFATDPIDMNIDYATAGVLTEALVEEVKRLREIVAGYNRHDAYLVQRRKVGELRDRLALLEPVWEAAKGLRDVVMSGNLNHERDAKQALYDAIDAAVAKEGK